ncbi:MAG: DUF1631 family protein [Caldimonas sp.]|uniref:DUF1631 family protein n=1 Tax=Caldimonas sp. TaxID=2838790 RepID=UPI00391AD10F
MSHPPALSTSLDSIVQGVPLLARDVVERTLEALRSPSAQLALAQDRRQFFALMEVLQARKVDWTHSLQELIAQGVREAMADAPAARPASRKPLALSLDDLSLVDESQAAEDIEISRIIAQIDQQAEWELREVQAFMAAVRGWQEIRREANPLRPEVFARALSRSTHELRVSAETRLLLLRMAGAQLAEALKAEYEQICRRLEALGVQPLAFRAVPSAAPAVPAGSAGFELTDSGTLGRLLERVSRSHPTPLDGAAEAETLVNRLFDQILADPKLIDAVRSLLGRLRPAVLGLAQRDPALVRQSDHPAWQLLNRLSAHCAGYDDPQDERLRDFMQFARSVIDRIVALPAPQAQHFLKALDDINQFIDERSREALERSRAALEKLQRIERADQLRGVLRQQVRQMQRAVLSQSLRDFLFGPWVDAMVEAMARHGEHSAQAQELMHTVDELLWSMQPLTAPADRARLRALRPELLASLNRGLDLIACPPAQRDAILAELSAHHGAVLRGQAPPAAPPAEALTPEQIVQQMRDEPDPLPPGPDEPVDRSVLPTVPVGLMDQTETEAGRLARQAWLARLTPGSWYHMFVQGQWVTAQLMWSSDNGQFFMFASQHAGHSHSLTRRAVERLLSEGLITLLEERSLMQRAVDSLIQDLDDPIR